MQQYQCIKQPKCCTDINIERRIFEITREYTMFCEATPNEDIIELYCKELDYEIPLTERVFYQCFVKYPYETNTSQKEIKEMDNIKRHKELCEQLNKTYIEKNKNYGDSFGISVRKYGFISALTRMSDKWNRLEQLILGRAEGSKDESLKDTLIDLSNYCLMTVLEIEREENEKLEIQYKQLLSDVGIKPGTCEDLEDLFKQSATLKSN